ncbi:threonine-phosphate decarboxylase CobD [Xanthobacteraceae bacterium Astr-EGSB]|uniref:threonine-phosphate decarboxylase CobD n=1 Tax=Astrobacterium formosum TaxID=3069710 RepID=UPI0027B5639F|nr:threonine-phosphate decarboxylase CobD [Xanthobacteraceae bacterium Astr-EGSB]
MKHGGDLSDAIRRHGGYLDDWLDLSTGINPWPWPVPAALDSAAWRRLPSAAALHELLAVARRAYAVGTDAAIIAAPGTQALIQWLPRLAAPGEVAIVATTYDEHARSWRAAGHEVVEIDDLDRLPATARHAVVVSPNNPDGRLADRDVLLRAATELESRGGWLVVDESFADVIGTGGGISAGVSDAIITLRSFGKFFGLAGLRLGFAIAVPAVVQRMTEALGPWPVSGPAIAIGTAALADVAWQQQMRRRLADAACRLDEVLAQAGLAVVGGTSLFRLIRHPQAATLHERLARRRIWTRIFPRDPDLMRLGLPADSTDLDCLKAALTDRHG